jgi:hypothetical protein
MSMIISFLSNNDLKYIYVFPFMTNVVLRVSHKECYWAYSDCMDLFYDGPSLNNLGNIRVMFLKLMMHCLNCVVW